ncbi:hypothetical protein KIN20_027460 [Parelaphostrongylus tenuis]|uniref:Uncharacterized protein n=1 Tax=Parelaphostrongylus tenuis TaxID=148309 RepID=A0AAD5WDT7_PARTN|nr:hypothetical protein KIN20_027460 [Parelaphostrongylus tenuis]
MSFSMRATRRGHPQCRSMQQMAEADTSCDSDGRLLSSPSPWPVGSLSVGGWRRSAVTSGTTTTAVPRVRSVDGLSLHLHLADRGNQSVYSNGGVGGPLSMNRSFDVNPPTTCYGDDFVETARRLRRSRLNLSNGRTKSAEFGQNGGYLHDLRDSPRLCTTIPPPVAYAGSQTDSGSDLLFGRRSEAYASTGRRNPQEYSLQQRRPQSSFGPRGAVQRFKRFGGHHGSLRYL